MKAVNCSFSGNDGPGLIRLFNYYAVASLKNCIVWRNSVRGVGISEIEHSCLSEEAPPNRAGNILADPLFVRTPDPGPDGIFDGVDDDYGDLRLRPGSPCIDAGGNDAVPIDVTTDFDGKIRFLDDGSSRDTGDSGARGVPIVDMGAFEALGDCNQNGIPDETEPDLDEDGAIDDCEVCIEDPLKTDPGICGCGTADIDTDLDGIMDCHDLCADTPTGSYVTTNGCVTGIYDLDRDGDVDHSDFGIMQSCYTNEQQTVPLGPECERPLSGGERGFDPLADLDAFTLCRSGASIPCDPQCAP
jgi:hypothetical protein